MISGCGKRFEKVTARDRLIVRPKEIGASKKDLYSPRTFSNRLALCNLLLDQHLSEFWVAGGCIGACYLSRNGRSLEQRRRDGYRENNEARSHTLTPFFRIVGIWDIHGAKSMKFRFFIPGEIA